MKFEAYKKPIRLSTASWYRDEMQYIQEASDTNWIRCGGDQQY